MSSQLAPWKTLNAVSPVASGSAQTSARGHSARRSSLAAAGSGSSMKKRLQMPLFVRAMQHGPEGGQVHTVAQYQRFAARLVFAGRDCLDGHEEVVEPSRAAQPDVIGDLHHAVAST